MKYNTPIDHLIDMAAKQTTIPAVIIPDETSTGTRTVKVTAGDMSEIDVKIANDATFTEVVRKLVTAYNSNKGV